MAPFLLVTKSSPPSGGAQKKKRKYTKFSNSERKTVLLAGFFPGDIRVTVDD